MAIPQLDETRFRDLLEREVDRFIDAARANDAAGLEAAMNRLMALGGAEMLHVLHAHMAAGGMIALAVDAAEGDADAVETMARLIETATGLTAEGGVIADIAVAALTSLAWRGAQGDRSAAGELRAAIEQLAGATRA